jgi:hypothetical protein
MMLYKPGGGTDAESVFDAIQSDCFVAMEQFGVALASEWQERLSVPVEYVTGPGGGVIVIRSAPGESPRRETENLYDSVQSATEADADVISTSVDSDVPYAVYLQDGTERVAARPHVPDPDEITDRLIDVIVDAIQGA